MVEQTEQTVRQAPYIEARSEQLLASLFGDPNAVQEQGESDANFKLRRFGRAGVGRDIPAYEVAGFSPDQIAAMQLARSGIGGFAPFMNLGASTVGQGVTTALSGAPLIQQGSQALTEADISQYFNPYQNYVTDEIRKQGEIARNKLAGAATKGGVFGGSRFGVAEGQLAGDVAAKIGQAQATGYAQALQAAENAKKRMLYGGQGLGSLGTQIGQLGGAGVGRDIPAYEVAGFSPDQIAAMQLARSGIGGFAPFMNLGASTVGQGVTTALSGAPLIQQGSQALTEADISQYFNPYQNYVTDEIRKQGEIARNKLAGAATKGGVFGGSRFGVAEGQLAGDVAAKIGQAQATGYAQALQAAENAKKRMLYGGQGLGSLGTQIGQLGGAQAGMGLDFQKAGLTDINSLLGIGALNQQLAQRGLDAARMTEEARQLEPFTRLGYASDILQGQPSSYSTYTSRYGGGDQGVSPFSQIAGLGLAGLGAYNKGLFG